MRKDDVCVLPYRTATQSGIASIAKFYQVPMVVTPVGELPNEIIPNQTGIVCESSKPIHIAQAINDCLDAMKIFSGRLKDEKDRASVILYLNQMSDNPIPLP